MSGGHIVGFSTRHAAVAAAFGVALALALACSRADRGTGPSGTATQVAVTPESSAVTVGNHTALSAVARDAAGNTLSGVQFFWSSNDSAIATVDQSGVVSTHSVGTAHIAASTQGVSGVATITVVSLPIASVVVAPHQATLRVTTTLQLSDTAVDAAGTPITGQTATWASNNTSVATVDAAGLVIARAVGTAQISATVAGVTGSATITVTLVPIASIAITPQGANVYVHQTTQLTATPEDSAGDPLTNRPITWESLASAVATVSSTGLVTGVATGAAVIQATAQGVIGEDAIKVSNAPVGSVVLSPASSQLFIGQTEDLTALVTDVTGAPIPGASVTYSSSATSVATVNPSTGVVTGVGVGIATMTGTSGGKSGQAAVAVFQAPIVSVTIQPADTTIAATGTAQLRVTVIDSLGHTVASPTVSWSSSPAGRVSGGGLVTPQPGDTGTAITVVASSGGVSGTATVNVSLPPAPQVASVTVVPADTTITATQTVQLQAVVTSTLGQPIPSAVVTWTSNPAGRVSPTGLVTPQLTDIGNIITVTAASGGQSGNASVDVAPLAFSAPARAGQSPASTRP
jgi:trimeric autotransporter adhesin